MTTPIRTTVLILLPLTLLVALTGCLSRPALLQQTFALYGPAITNVPAGANGRVLSLRAVEVSPLFDGRALTYRTGPESYELDPYASFLVDPARTIAIPLRAYLRNSGAFQDVIEAGSPLVADTFLQVHVSELHGDFRPPGPPAAVLSLRLTFFRSGNSNQPQVLLQKDYSRRVPLAQKTAAAVVGGWDQALAEIMAEVASDLAASR